MFSHDQNIGRWLQELDSESEFEGSCNELPNEDCSDIKDAPVDYVINGECQPESEIELNESEQSREKENAIEYSSSDDDIPLARIMIRPQEDNYILKCRKLFNQYLVDMDAKIETERLNFIRFNQAKLRSEEYIHLRDAVMNHANVNSIERLTILPATYIGSPRHMHEYAQDAMSYVRHYGRPDLFITFTCNPKWNDIKCHLFPGQSTTDRHDLTAHVFREKQKAMMDLIVKLRVFGEVRCFRKIRPDQIDKVIPAEIPDEEIDPQLFDVVTKNRIHGPCGAINPTAPCMIDNKCSKRYPRALVDDTITGNDGYPLCRRRSAEDGGNSTVIKVRNQDVDVDNRWVVPYSPLLSKIFEAHINVEYCNSVKSIKYICKYVNKGSDMAVFGVADYQSIDEIQQYQMGRYISSNEAFISKMVNAFISPGQH
ncbi:uncharacterized protein LOC120779563 [Bactrocera tryoni]|uniref:uncharacterized protein LOC120779563 n=1 Tax=Bactrocera tryoni TaxID=59916 RepID=UPI001A977EE9|nr:uncharacterized protein LOC120779563 [Bactrocera tryoni]